MEDQQPAASDLTNDGSRTGTAVETEAVESGKAEPQASDGEQEAPRRRSLFRRSARRRGRDRAADGQQDAGSPDESGDSASESGQERDDTVLQRAEGDNAAREPAENGDVAVAESADANEESATDEGEKAAPEAVESSAEKTRARKPVGKLLVATVLIAAALFVGSAAFAGATVQPYLADRALLATKLDIARTAANAVTTLWSYTPDNLDKLGDRAANYLSGDFEAQYRKFVDALVAPNKQAQVTNSTVVTGAAVESLEGPTAVALVYTNTTSTSPLTKGIPSLRYLSYRLFMKREHARWLVTRMTTITSLDLTPRL